MASKTVISSINEVRIAQKKWREWKGVIFGRAMLEFLYLANLEKKKNTFFSQEEKISFENLLLLLLIIDSFCSLS